VTFDGLLGNVEFAGDLLVELAFDDHGEDAQLLGR
jgi:hypothetical protein